MFLMASGNYEKKNLPGEQGNCRAPQFQKVNYVAGVWPWLLSVYNFR